MHLIFEETTSALYYSNDGRLHLVRVPGEGERYTIDSRFDIIRVENIATDALESGEIVFSTKNRTLADAYIAGYDLATRP